MKSIWIIVAAMLCFNVAVANSKKRVDVIPFVKEYSPKKGSLKLDSSFEIIYLDESVEPIAKMLSKDIYKASGIDMKISANQKDGSIILALDPTLEGEEYTLTINKNVELKAKDFQTLSLATSTIVQLLEVQKRGVTLPKLTIKDYPSYEWRNVMIDLARKWHPYESLEKIVDYLHFYKVKYMHLHLSDDQLFVFGTEAFPQIVSKTADGERRYYTKEELKKLVEYARVRGVTIIPEIDLPGHSGNMWKKLPSIFGYVDPETGKAVGLSTVNMASERCYAALEVIISEVIEVFSTSPYFHLGGDEVWMGNISKIPDFKEFCEKNNLRADKPNDLYVYFLKRIDDIIRKYGKKTILWEGFPDNGQGGIEIPNDIPIIAWNTHYNSPVKLFQHGYDVIHSMWFPFYMCGGMSFAPSAEMGYNWVYNEYHHWQPYIQDMTLPKENTVIGAQMCFWEQNYDWTYDIIENRLPASATRWWNYEDKTPFKEYEKVYNKVFAKLDKVINPVEFNPEGLIYENDIVFENKLSIEFNTDLKGNIKYFLSDFDWILTPDKWLDYNSPVVINESKIVTAALFDNEGNMVGYPRQKRYYKIDPIIEYTCYGGAPRKGWKEMPDFDTLPVLRKGVFGEADEARLKDVGRIYFVKYNMDGFIDTRPYQITNAFGLEMKSKVNLPVSGKYKFIIDINRAVVSLKFGDNEAVTTAEGKEKHEIEIDLEKGEQDLLMNYFNQNIGNKLIIRCILPGTEKEVPLTDFIIPINNEK